jgi:hypothetical protein
VISMLCRPGATRPDGLIASAELPTHAAAQPHDARANDVFHLNHNIQPTSRKRSS